MGSSLYIDRSYICKLFPANILCAILLVSLHNTDFVVATISQDTHVQNRNELEEFCHYETFRPQCWKNEVVVMQEAIYGRRQVGRCIEAENSDLAKDPRYLGCYADVLELLDARCSGKKECELRIPDPDLEEATSCVKSLKMFLEVRYTCVEVVEPDRSCVVSVTSSPLHIAAAAAAAAGMDSWSTQSNIGCGTETQPWMLEAPAGQRINISLLDFTAAARLTSQHLTRSTSRIITSSSSSSSGSCVDENHQYGYIIDKSSVNKKNVSVCHARSNRQTHLYLSTSNTLQLVLTAIDRQRDNFLLRVEAAGCSNLVPPADAWMRRSGDELIIGCYTSRQTWQLTCRHQRWIGVLSNCTTGSAGVAVQKEIEQTLLFDEYQVLAIVAVSFVGLAVCLTIICCGVFCLRRYSCEHDAENTVQSRMKYNMMSCQTGGGRDQLLPGSTGYDDVKRINNGDVSTGPSLGGPQYFVLDQEYVNNRDGGVL